MPTVQLPEAPAPGRRAAVRITKDALRHVRGGHPWIFDESIESVSHAPATGDLVVVFDDRRRFAAIGLWDATSPMRIKVLHAGAPETIDAGFFARSLGAALARRGALLQQADSTGYRLVHGENDALPGLIVDVYDRTVVVKLYTAAWWPHLRVVLTELLNLVDADRVVLRLSRLVAAEMDGTLGDGDVLVGDAPPAAVAFRENGLLFTADVVRGQKTGHFLDQRDNRRRVGELAAGAEVLDVFCHTGGFSLHAAAGGATSVLSTDRSEPALSAAERHVAMNRADLSVSTCRHRTQRGDAFEVLADLGNRGRRFDLVVIDPPSFAARQRDVEGALRAYRKLAELGVAVLAPGGTLVQASCSSRVSTDRFAATVVGAARAGGVEFSAVEVTGHAVDHPVGFPEGAYLKAVIAQR